MIRKRSPRRWLTSVYGEISKNSGDKNTYLAYGDTEVLVIWNGTNLRVRFNITRDFDYEEILAEDDFA